MGMTKSDGVLAGRSGGGATIAVGLAGLVYSVAFVAVVVSDARAPEYVAACSLLVAGLLAAVVAVVLYLHLRPADQGVALCALIFGSASGLASSIHGGFDLARLINPTTAGLDFPNPVDPRGMMTFAVAGLAVFGWSLLIARSSSWPRALAGLGYLSSMLLIIIYLGRLIALDPKNPVLLGPAVIEGLVVNPLWFIGAGRHLMRAAEPASPIETEAVK